MHKFAKEIMECVKTKVNAMGIDNIEGQHLEELKMWSCIAKDIAEYDYYCHITEAMEKPENEYGVNYDENGRYYSQPRMSNGQFRPDMRRRGFDEMYDRMPMYYDDMQNGRMYYTTSDAGMGSTMGASNVSYTSGRGYSDSGYERARRGYEESRQMDPNDEHMDKLKEVFNELKDEMKELKPHMTSNAKTYARSELTNMANNMV